MVSAIAKKIQNILIDLKNLINFYILEDFLEDLANLSDLIDLSDFNDLALLAILKIPDNTLENKDIVAKKKSYLFQSS